MLQVNFTYSCEKRPVQTFIGLGAGNSFLGGLAAGLALAEGDVYEGK
jgi:hypothetical protein